MMKLELVRKSVVVNAVIGRDTKMFLAVFHADLLTVFSPHLALRSAINFGEARTNKPRRSTTDKPQLQSDAHAAPCVEVGQHEAGDSNNFQDAIEINGLRQLFKDTLYTKSAHDKSLSGRCMSRMICGSLSSTGARLP